MPDLSPRAKAVRAASARLAALERHHPANTVLIASARRDLLIARANAKMASAQADLVAADSQGLL